MNATSEQSLIAKIQALSPEQVAEVEDFVEFLSAKIRRPLDRLQAIAPTLETAGIEPMKMEEINAEVKAARAERRARQQGSGADRS